MKSLLVFALACLAFAWSDGFSADNGRYDFIISGGMVVDGTGNPWYRADIGIIGDKIAEIGKIPAEQGKRVIDATGKMVTPGFVDIHSHCESGILDNQTVHNMVTQGVTTVIGGNCGGSPLELGAFFSEVELKGIGVNLGVLTGHNSIRRKVMGNEGREPTAAELESMKEIVAHEMQAGALGLSTGLKYRPGVYAKTAEVVELARVAASYGGFYASHLRDEGHGLLESVQEAIGIGEQAGIAVQMSHHKAVGKDMWGKTRESLALMEQARGRGLDVTTDLHPYPATFTGMTIIFPAWAIEGSEKAIKQRLADPPTREKVIEGIVWAIVHDRGGNDPANLQVGGYPTEPLLEGMNFHEILLQRGVEPSIRNAAELALEFYEHGGASIIYHCLDKEDVVRTLSHPLAMIASDAGNAHLGQSKPHPRHYGCFPRVLAMHVRDQGDLRLEQAVRKMTSFPAFRVGAKDRGIINRNMAADIVVFDPDNVQDKATWTNPHQYAEGIEYVFVNGTLVVEQAKVTGNLPGRIVYGSRKIRH
jgi:N-acyl-D-amino-acid deacylase